MRIHFAQFDRSAGMCGMISPALGVEIGADFFVRQRAAEDPGFADESAVRHIAGRIGFAGSPVSFERAQEASFAFGRTAIRSNGQAYAVVIEMMRAAVDLSRRPLDARRRCEAR